MPDSQTTATDDFGWARHMRWRLAAGADERLRQTLNSAAWCTRATLIKRNAGRSVYRVSPTAGEPAFYVKHDHPRGPRNRARALLRCKARREYKACVALRAAGVPTVRALAWGRRGLDGALVSAALADARSFGVAWQAAASADATRAAFVAALCAFLRTMTAAGVRHADLHADNVLVQGGAGGAWRFVLVDVAGVRMTGRVRPAQLHRQLFWLEPLLCRLPEAAGRDLYAAAGVGESPAAWARARANVRAALLRTWRRKWRGRRGRLLRDGSVCARHVTPAGRWLCRPPFTVARGEAAVRGHRDVLAAGGAGILKRDVKRVLTRVETGDGTVVVKEFTRPGPWGRFAADARSWLMTHRLQWCGMPAVRAFAWLRMPNGRGLLILEDAGDRLLHSLLRDTPTMTARLPWLARLAGLLARLHAFGIEHRDLKLANIMVVDSAAAEPLRLVDLDDVRFHAATLSVPARARNLAPLLESMPGSVTRQEVVRLFALYRSAADLDRAAARRIMGEAR